MKRMLIVSGLTCCVLAPQTFAQDLEVTCGDYSVMDNAQQMETIAAIESATSEMERSDSLTAEQIHEKLAADCKDQVDVLVIEVVKGYLQ